MIQKIIKVGNSAAVTIPKDFLKLTKTSVGAEVVLQLKPEFGQVIINLPKKKKPLEKTIDKEIYLVAKSLLKRYRPALKELAKR